MSTTQKEINAAAVSTVGTIHAARVVSGDAMVMTTVMKDGDAIALVPLAAPGVDALDQEMTAVRDVVQFSGADACVFAVAAARSDHRQRRSCRTIEEGGEAHWHYTVHLVTCVGARAALACADPEDPAAFRVRPSVLASLEVAGSLYAAALYQAMSAAVFAPAQTATAFQQMAQLVCGYGSPEPGIRRSFAQSIGLK